jgi:hypothetical protein
MHEGRMGAHPQTQEEQIRENPFIDFVVEEEKAFRKDEILSAIAGVGRNINIRDLEEIEVLTNESGEIIRAKFRKKSRKHGGYKGKEETYVFMIKGRNQALQMPHTEIKRCVEVYKEEKKVPSRRLPKKWVFVDGDWIFVDKKASHARSIASGGIAGRK